VTLDGSRPVLTLGETMGLISGDRIGTFAHTSAASISVGGAETNVAVGLSRMGIPARWVGRVGEDSLGRRVVREARGEGIEVHAHIDRDAPTGLMLKEFTGAGSARVYYYRAGSAGSRLQPEDVPAGVVESAALVHLTGITPLLSESARETCMEAIRRAKAAGVTVSFDVNYRSSIASSGRAAEELTAIAASSDIVFGSIEELALLAPDADRTAEGLAAALDPSGGREIVVKLGADGASVFAEGKATHAAGYEVEVVDTVGAGDAFVAGYLSGVVRGTPVGERLRRANGCGALMCTVPGDWEAAPTEAELEAFLRGGGDPVSR
jgi:2-dehydro-3-deoxygluconokinase